MSAVRARRDEIGKARSTRRTGGQHPRAFGMQFADLTGRERTAQCTEALAIL